jgi:transposase
VRLLFQDEGRFGRISDQRRCWAPLPSRPVVGHQVVREYVYVMAAVSPKDGRFASLVMPWVDTEVMSIFLAHTAQEFPDDLCVMLIDGAGWHRANDLRVPKNMVLIPLLPYSPELNPVEHLWEYLRDVFGNKTFTCLEEVIDLLCVTLKLLFRNPETVRSMTCFDWINTLCLMSN